ncbi:hypothetical protein N7G274_000131 [Stereocaulon virgatum]|uniref:J domain-containing protein n=1 Tax=Stereocaulon virgatum TaxID=373712 RepID=A0ABR4ARZ3_9LECA
MPSDDLKNYATSDTDFYALLGITFETSQKDIDRAWRKTALKYHPDKVGPDPSAREKFHLAQIGYDLLSNPASKALYDNARIARLQRKRQNELFEGRRRQMKDDLEARERGLKRPREDDDGDEEKLEREIQRLAEDGKRRRKEREEALKRDIQKDADTTHAAPQTPGPSTPIGRATVPAQSGVSELDRTVKVRWPVEGEGSSTTADQIKNAFSRFGQIESADLLTPKMLRLGKKQKKQLGAVCMVQYKSVVGAHAAVEDFPKQQQEDPEWKMYDSVSWAADKQPESLGLGQPVLSNPTTNSSIRTSNFGTNTPSMEERTLIRLKNLEKKRLAAEIQRQEEEADAAEAQKAGS